MVMVRVRVVTFFIACFLSTVSAQLENSFPLPPSQCEISMRVDPASASNWRQDYDEYINGSVSVNSTLKLTCDNLQEALVAMHTTIVHRSNNCIELIVPKGTHQITEAVELSRNIHIRGEQPGEVLVNFSITISEKVSFFNVLTLMNADHVEISGIEFFNSPGSIAIENVSLVRVSDSSFRWFSQGALNIYQCFAATVFNCTFEYNGFTGATKGDYQYRGHAGGLSIGFDDNHYSVNGTDPSSVPDIKGVHISDCTFRNNTSDPRDSGNLISTSELFKAFIFPGRGGAIAITINTSFPFNTSINNCVIAYSNSTTFGGGLYIAYSGYAPHFTSINETLFEGNHCDGPGGGLQHGFIESGSNEILRLKIHNSEFYSNSALFGGAVNFISNVSYFGDDGIQLTSEAKITNCTFKENTAVDYGAALALASLVFFRDSSNVKTAFISDCTFNDNDGGRAGVVSAAYLPISFHGRNVFHQNRGRVLVISGTRAEIHGPIHFISNDGSPIDAGAMYITSFGHIQLHTGAEIEFLNNTGIIGASVVVVSIAAIAEPFTRLLHNPLCAVQSENSTDPPQNWQAEMHFSGNNALYGSTVFLNDINLCSWRSLGPVYFNVSEVFRWEFVNFSDDNVNRAHVPEDTNPLYYVQTPARHISLTSENNVTAFPGEKIAINVTGIDHLGQYTSVGVSISDSQGQFTFRPAAAAPSVIKDASITTTLFLESHLEGTMLHNVSSDVTVSTIFTQNPLSLTISVRLKECPAGYVLMSLSNHAGLHFESRSEFQHFCECNEENNLDIIACDQWKIILRDGLWGIHSKLIMTRGNDSLVTYPCPPQYCQCFNSTKFHSPCHPTFDPLFPDEQCHPSRKGELCGDCKNASDGFTVLLNRCQSCDPANWLIIPILIFADAVAIGVLLMVPFSPPSWIYPALYYLQAVPYVVLHFPTSFDNVQPYVYYVSSGLSFFFIRDFCLGRGITAELIYFVRFIPLIVSVILTFIVGVVRSRYYRFVNKPWPGLWCVVLFQYTHVIHTSMSILNCPILPGDDGLVSPRWYVNGNITCFTGIHLPLALFACVVLLFCVSLIPIVVLYTQGYIERPRFLLNCVLPLSSTFIPSTPWWGAVELARRFLLVIVIFVIPQNSYPAIFCLMITLAVGPFIQPYKQSWTNFIEGLLVADVLILLLLRETDYLKTVQLGNSTAAISTHASVLTPFYYIPLIVFTLAAIVSIIFSVRSCYLTRKRSSQVGNDQNDHRDMHQLQSNYYRADHHPSTISIEVSTEEVPLSRLMSRLFTGGARKNKQYYPKQNDEQSATANMKSNSLPVRPKHVAIGTLKSRVKRVTNRIKHRYRSTYSGSGGINSNDVRIDLKPVNDSQSTTQNSVDLV